MRKIISLIAHPVVWVAHHTHPLIPHPKVKREHLHVSFGSVVIMAGSAIAHCAPHGLSFTSVAIDSLGYGIHALGAAPIIKVICVRLRVDV
jgi:hypothetical protein